MADRYAEEYGQYLREVRAYNQQVQHGRRVPRAEPSSPEYSQSAEDQRMAQQVGVTMTPQDAQRRQMVEALMRKQAR